MAVRRFKASSPGAPNLVFVFHTTCRPPDTLAHEQFVQRLLAGLSADGRFVAYERSRDVMCGNSLRHERARQ